MHCHRNKRPFKCPSYHWCGDYKSNAKRKQTKNNDEYSDKFKAFYAAYPKEISPGSAWKAWLNIDESYHDLIIERAGAYASIVTIEERDLQYVKHPATWLNAGDWRQEITRKVDPRDCVDCGASYIIGFKYGMKNRKKEYRCAGCSKARSQ
jgi:hypothetical protein